jgi:hypothetical protein
MTVRAERSVSLPKGLEAVGLALNKWNDDLLPGAESPKQVVSRKGNARRTGMVQPVVLKANVPPPLAMPLLTGPVRQRLVAAPRRFNLGWVGGKPPFTVELAMPGASPDDAPPSVFQAGEERVVSSVIAPPGIARVMSGARLANIDGGLWRLEAEVRLADEGRDNYAAALMAGRLMAGKDLPDPLAGSMTTAASLGRVAEGR